MSTGSFGFSIHIIGGFMEDKKTPVFEEIRRNVAGIDLAWRADHYVCGPRREDGNREIASFGTTTPELYKMLNWLQERHVESVAIESTSVYWIPTAELLESKGIEVVLVDAREVRMVPGRKSDVKDCQWLQKLHSCGLLRGAFRPPETVKAIRTVLREKENVTAMRIQAIQQMQKSLDQMNIRVHHAVSDIDGKTGMAIVQAIVQGEREPMKLAKLRDPRCKKSVEEIAEHLTGTWRAEHLFNLEQAFLTLQFLNDRIENFDKKVSEMFALLAKDSNITDDDIPPSVTDKKQITKHKNNLEDVINIYKIIETDLTAISGIGRDILKVIVSELGFNFDCFDNEKSFVSYIGLAPRLGKSAGKNVHQSKCKNTSRVGQILRTAASTLYKSTTALGAYFRSVASRIDRIAAVKATARKIAQLIFRAVKFGKEFIDIGEKEYNARNRERVIKNMKRKAKALNISPLELGFII
jgi:transposase